MRNRTFKIRRARAASAACLAAVSVLLSGCQAGKTVPAETPADQAAGGNVEETSKGEDIPEKMSTFQIGDTEISLEEDDDYADWSGEDVTYIKLSDAAVSIEGNGAEVDGAVVKITDGGIYVLSGTWPDGSVEVDAAGKGTVRLVLNGVEIHSEESAPVYVKKADKTVISLEDGTVNTLSDSEGLVYTEVEKEEPNAVIFSKDDLTINGTGTLVVNASFNHGINGKDRLILMSGNYQVTSAGSAFKGKDLLAVIDGNYEITAGNDGMHSDGNLGILGGGIEILESKEGLEGGTILIGNGTISLKSSDDGINAASDGEIASALYIDGGTVVVDAEGDGIDSNGDIYMTGGDVTVYGPLNNGNGALDYDGVFEMSGGNLAAFGVSGMARTVSSGSPQNAIMMTYSEQQPAGTDVVLNNGDGEELHRWTGTKAFDSLVVSVPELTVDESYVLVSGGNEVGFTLESAVTYLKQDGVTEGRQMDQGGRGGRPGGGNRMGEPGQAGRPGPPEEEGKGGGTKGSRPGDENGEAAEDMPGDTEAV